MNMYSSFASESVSTLLPMQYSLPGENDVDKKTMDPTYYIDIKSEGLRDILRTVLRDVRTVNLNEDKPAVQLRPIRLSLPLTGA